MKSLLISGSRIATAAMLDYARAAVTNAKERGWCVIVGDAFGVDRVVADECRALDVQVFVYGIAENPRNGALWAGKNMYTWLSGAQNYRQRDEHMVRLANSVLCIWNGESKGTKHVYDYAKRLKKVAWLAVVDEDGKVGIVPEVQP